MDRYAVIGNPIAHSLSPRIHSLFAQQTQQNLTYDAILAPKDGFAAAVERFRSEGGKGLNITLPFKLTAWTFVDERSERAQRARAVNTIVLRSDNRSYGDNTDGIGLLRDLTHNLSLVLKGLDVLILGAGGAVRGILGPLLAAQPGRVVIANRTVERAVDLKDDFADTGNIEARGFEDLSGHAFDLILNGTSASVGGQVPPIPDGTMRAGGICYDLFYAQQPTAFVRWGQQHGAGRSLDGLGMLVEQAAESFRLWRGIRPHTLPVIRTLSGAE